MLKRAVTIKSASEESFVGRGFCRFGEVCTEFMVLHLLRNSDSDKKNGN